MGNEGEEVKGKEVVVATVESLHFDKEGEVCPETNHEVRGSQVHLKLRDMDTAKMYNWFLYDSNHSYSAIWKVIMKFYDLGMVGKDLLHNYEDRLEIFEAIVENLNDRPVKFEKRKFGRQERSNWFPVEIMG